MTKLFRVKNEPVVSALSGLVLKPATEGKYTTIERAGVSGVKWKVWSFSLYVASRASRQAALPLYEWTLASISKSAFAGDPVHVRQSFLSSIAAGKVLPWLAPAYLYRELPAKRCDAHRETDCINTATVIYNCVGSEVAAFQHANLVSTRPARFCARKEQPSCQLCQF